MKNDSIFLLFICLITVITYPMKNDDSRASTLAYSTELNQSTDFNFTPVSSPREPLTIPQEKKSCWFSCLKKLYCFCCCNNKKPNDRLVIEYETIH